MLRIDPTAAQPPFEQVRSQIIDQIDSGELAPGTKLPSVRRLAGDLGLAPNTIARAYRELEGEGYVRTAGRHGTIVATPGVTSQAEDAQAQALADAYVRGMRGLGVRAEDLIAYVRRAQAALE